MPRGRFRVYTYVLRYTCIRCIRRHVRVYMIPLSKSIRAGDIVTSVASVHHHSLFFVSPPALRRPPPVSALLTCHHMTPFSRPMLQLRHPKCYTIGTEPHKNHRREKNVAREDRQILQTERYRPKMTREEIRNCVCCGLYLSSIKCHVSYYSVKRLTWR